MSFISETKALKLYFNDKVEIISNWDEKIYWVNGSMKIPAIVRLKYYVRWVPKRTPFDRSAVFRRDNFLCAYCFKALSANQLTIDHIIPKSQGGLNNWINTISACSACNNKKDDRTPEQAGMELLFKPYVPRLGLRSQLYGISNVHKDWDTYLK